MINHMVLRQEILRDPQGVGYADMTHADVAAYLNDKQFYQTEMTPAAQEELDEAFFNNILYATKTPVPALFGMRIAESVKRSRAELLFGPDTVVTEQDVRVALLS